MEFHIVKARTLESPLDSKEINPINPKGNQSWIFIGRTDMKAEAPIIWPPDAKNWLTGKNHDAGKDWRQEKGTTEDEMVGWHHQFNGHEFEQALEVGDGQGSLCAAVHGVTKSQTWLREWTELIDPLPKLNGTANLEMSTSREASYPKKLEREVTEMCECVNHPFFFLFVFSRTKWYTWKPKRAKN